MTNFLNQLNYRTKTMFAKAGLQHLAKHLNSSSQVLMRADFNVPIKSGAIKDPKRITATIPTIQEILKHNPKSLVLISHMGRPNGKKVPELTLKPVVAELEKHLNRRVNFLQDCVGQSVINRVKSSQNQIFLCQNVRYHPEQTGSVKNSDGSKAKVNPQKIKAFRNQLSQLGSCFVNDAFGAAHRAHSSVVGINHQHRVAGLLMEKQLKFLGNFLQSPRRPVLAILGGAKVGDKLPLVKNMLNFANQIILGGGMKNPFLTKVFGRDMGASINIMPENPDQLNQIVQLAKKKGVKLHFPVDYRVANSNQIKSPTNVRIMTQQEAIPKNQQVFDIGPQAGKQYDEIIQRAGSIFWNGPVGVIETPQFRVGSQDILYSMIRATKNGATTIIGGGDSASLVSNLKVEDQLTFVSTGGGATIQLFQGKQLPGVKNLSKVEQVQQPAAQQARYI